MLNNFEKTAIVILAAGLGKRMKSSKAKVLHEICGRTLIQHVVETASKVVNDRIIIVIGHQAELVKKVISNYYEVSFAYQKTQLGTGHAVLCALSFISDQIDHVVILCGDVPLLRVDTLRNIIEEHVNKKNDITLLGVELENPTGYGRIIVNGNGNVSAIVEEVDADSIQKKINLVNTGILCVRKELLFNTLTNIKTDNLQQEIYLTDIIKIAYEKNRKIGNIMSIDKNEVIGINTPDDLLSAENIFNKSLGKKS